MNIVVSAKIPIHLKKADKYGIKMGKVLRKTLEDKIRTIENEILSSKLDEISDKIGCKIKREDIIKSVRSSRDER